MSNQRKFTVELHDYACGIEPESITAARIERVIERMIEKDVSDGYVIVTEEKSDQGLVDKAEHEEQP